MTDAKPIRDDSEFSDTDRPSDLELAMAAAWDPEELGTVSIDESIADTLDAHESMDASLSGSSVAQERPAAPDAGSIDHAPEPLPGAILSDPGTIPYGWESIDLPEPLPDPLPDPLQIDFPGADPLPVGWGEVGGSESLPVAQVAPVADIRVVGTDIIGTGIRVYSAWEPSKIGSGGHSTITWCADSKGWFGRIGTGPLPRDLDALPARSAERSAAVRAWHAAEYDRAYAAILARHPEAGSGRRDMGQIEVTR
jgi:hypothetical protein